MNYLFRSLIFICSLLSCVVSSASAAVTEQAGGHEYLLNKAEYFLLKDPKRTLTILAELDSASKLERTIALKKLLLQAKALLTQRQNVAAQLAISQLYDYAQSSEFRKTLFDNLYISATWLRRAHHHQAATDAYRCALKKAQTQRQAIRALNGLANVLREQGDFATAAAVYQQAISQAQKVSDKLAIASLQNNLGTAYLDGGEFSLAKTAFAAAFEQFQMMEHQAARLNAGLNLLFAALMSQDLMLYQRLITRVEKLTVEYNNLSRLAYLDWIKLAYRFQQTEPLSDKQKHYLSEQFSAIDDVGLQRVIKQYLAAPMAVTVAIKTTTNSEPLTEHGSWVATLTQCNW